MFSMCVSVCERACPDLLCVPDVCCRNIANHQYAKVYETQEDLCRKRNEIRKAHLQLAAIKAQVGVFTFIHSHFVYKYKKRKCFCRDLCLRNILCDMPSCRICI